MIMQNSGSSITRTAYNSFHFCHCLNIHLRFLCHPSCVAKLLQPICNFKTKLSLLHTFFIYEASLLHPTLMILRINNKVEQMVVFWVDELHTCINVLQFVDKHTRNRTHDAKYEWKYNSGNSCCTEGYNDIAFRERTYTYVCWICSVLFTPSHFTSIWHVFSFAITFKLQRTFYG